MTEAVCIVLARVHCAPSSCNALPRRFCAAVRPTASIGAFDRGKLDFSEKLTAAAVDAYLALQRIGHSFRTRAAPHRCCARDGFVRGDMHL